MTLGDTAKLALESAGGVSLTVSDFALIGVIGFVVGLTVVAIARAWQERDDKKWRAKHAEPTVTDLNAAREEVLAHDFSVPPAPTQPSPQNRYARVVDHHARRRSEPPTGAA